MESNKENKGLSSEIVKRSPEIAGLKKIDFIETLKEAEAIAEYVINSDAFGLVFEKTIKDKDGKDIKVKNKNDVITAIITGKELGLTPMASIVFGKQLDRHAFFKVMKGAALGLDPITSLDQINVISTKNGDIIHTGISVIASALLRNGINFEILEDAVEDYSYHRIKDDAEIGKELKDNYFVVNSKSDPKKLKEATERGDILVIKKVKDIKTTVRLDREDKSPLVLTYKMSQAIEADLYKGLKRDGSTSDGKANWNNHFETMLRNRTLTIAGRIYGADVIQGTYSNEEAEEIITILDENENVDTENLEKKINADIGTKID